MDYIFSDKNLIVCIKPVGLDSEKQVPQAIINDYGGEIFTLHRLDKNVGGVMIYARNKATAAELSRIIQEGKMIKEYVALVHGVPPESGDWTDLLFKDSSKNKVFTVKRMRKGVKEARLEFNRLTSGEDSLVRIKLHTGRSHQIRVQFSSRGFPLVGDRKYGSKSEVKEPMLYSCKISFPYKGEFLEFESYPEWGKL